MDDFDLINTFCTVDDFCKEFEPEWEKTMIDDRKRRRSMSLSLSEIMTIVVHFHQSSYRTFKDYYQKHVRLYLKKYFPRLFGYGRFVQVMKLSIFPLFCFLQYLMGSTTGIAIVDSTPLPVCHNKRIYSHKVFKDIAQRGKSSTGWFFGFKLHIVINDVGELLGWRLTSGNVDDRKPVPDMCEELKGVLLGDKGYISSKLFDQLYEKGIKLVTKIKKNMKNKLMDLREKFLLRKRGVVECVIQHLKEGCQVSHTRHRSSWNFMANLLGGLAAYCLYPNKPSMGLSRNEQVTLQSCDSKAA